MMQFQKASSHSSYIWTGQSKWSVSARKYICILFSWGMWGRRLFICTCLEKKKKKVDQEAGYITTPTLFKIP